MVCKNILNEIDGCPYFHRMDEEVGVLMREGFKRVWCNSSGRDYDACPLNMYHPRDKPFKEVREELDQIMRTEAGD